MKRFTNLNLSPFCLCFNCRSSRQWRGIPARWTRLCSLTLPSSCWPSACSLPPGFLCILPYLFCTTFFMWVDSPIVHIALHYCSALWCWRMLMICMHHASMTNKQKPRTVNTFSQHSPSMTEMLKIKVGNSRAANAALCRWRHLSNVVWILFVWANP